MSKITLTLITLLASTIVFAQNETEENFATQLAHERGFYGCDKAINSTFSLLSPEVQKRVVSGSLKTVKDTIQLTALFGSNNDSLITDVVIRKMGKACIAYSRTIVTTNSSCAAYSSEMKAFSLENEFLDFTSMVNKGGVPMILKPLNNGCIAMYYTTLEY